jgi:hypothetical protein
MWDMLGYLSLAIVVAYLAVVLCGVLRGKFDADDDAN